MIPLRDENPSRTIPVVNTCLILTHGNVKVHMNRDQELVEFVGYGR